MESSHGRSVNPLHSSDELPSWDHVLDVDSIMPTWSTAAPYFSCEVQSRQGSVDSSNSVMTALSRPQRSWSQPTTPEVVDATFGCFDVLSNDAATMVFAALDAVSLASIMCVNRRIRCLAADKAIWRQLLTRALEEEDSRWSLDHDVPLSMTRADICRLLCDRARTPLVWHTPRVVRGGSVATTQEADTRLELFEGGLETPPPAVSGMSRRLLVSKDGLCVRYIGESLGGNRAVRCESPLPSAPFDTLRYIKDEASSAPRLELIKQCTVVYFEVAIGSQPAGESDRSTDDCIAVGVGSDRFPLSGCQPGWDEHSYGYHSDDGRLFHGSGSRSQAFGPRFVSGDVVGCGVSLLTRRIFFTHNGAFLGTGFVAEPSQLPLYPLVRAISAYFPIYLHTSLASPHISRRFRPCRATCSRARLAPLSPRTRRPPPLALRWPYDRAI